MHHPSLLRLRAALVLAFVAVLALSACSRREAADTPAAGGAGASAAGTPAAELRLGYFPNITHAPALIGVANGYFQQELGSTKLDHADLQRGPRRGLRAAGQLPGRRLHRLRPGDQRVREEQRRGRPADRGLHLGRRAARRLARHHLARAAQGQDHRDAAGGEHAGHRVQEVAEGEQPHERHRAGRRDRAEHRQPPHARPVQVGAGRRRLAAGAVELAARATPAPRCSSTRRACGRAASSRPRVLIVRTEFLQEHPQTVEALLRAEQKSIDFAAGGPGPGQDGDERRDQAADELLADAGGPRPCAFTELSFGNSDPLAATFPQLGQGQRHRRRSPTRRRTWPGSSPRRR